MPPQPPQLKVPHGIKVPSEAHQEWLKLLAAAETLVEEDRDLQAKAAKGLFLKPRNLPPEVLGRAYSQYCVLINNIYDTYLNNVHLQRAPYMLEIVNVFTKRLFELRKEIVFLIVNDYIYVDTALVQKRLTPQQIEIVVPYHFPLECREDTIEKLIQKMWADSHKRKNAPLKVVKPQPPPTSERSMFSDVEMPAMESSECSEDESEPEPSVHTIIPEEYIQATIIQAHERFRKWFMIDFKNKCKRRRLYFANKGKIAPEAIRNKAATMIQRAYREYMKLKRKHVLSVKRDMMLGLIPEPFVSKFNFEEENTKTYERRRKTRAKLQETFLKELEREQIRLLVFRKEDLIDDVTEDIREWFMEWYYSYGFFPEFPHEQEGGTLLVIRGDFPTIEEKIIEDEKYAATIKGKTKDQLKEEKQREKQEAILKAEMDKETAKKEAENLFKMRCNPPADPGYKVQSSECMDSLIEALQRYRAAWSFYDRFPPEGGAEVIYGYLHDLMTEDLMSQIHIDVRRYVDEMMRLDLKLLIKMHQLMYKRVGWKYPKIKPRSKPRKLPTPYKPINVDQKLLNQFEVLFDLGLISKPTTKLKDVIGDTKYAAYEFNIQDPDVSFPPPGYGDVKNRLVLSCVYGIGLNPGATRNKAVLLMGPTRNGKSFLVDAVAGELNAVKIDITPEVFSAVIKKPGKNISLVFQAARVFQPSVIFLKDIERVFAKKVQNKKLNATSLKKALPKLLKSLPADDKVIFIATCSEPCSAKAEPMLSPFNEVILVPPTDYGTLYMFFHNKLQAIRSIPRDYCVQSLACKLQGYGFGVIHELFDKIMSPERIVRLNVYPLGPLEFLTQLIEDEIESTTSEDYKDYVNFFIKHSYLKKVRPEYDIINSVRKEVYKKLDKAEKKG